MKLEMELLEKARNLELENKQAEEEQLLREILQNLKNPYQSLKDPNEQEYVLPEGRAIISEVLFRLGVLLAERGRKEEADATFNDLYQIDNGRMRNYLKVAQAEYYLKTGEINDEKHWKCRQLSVFFNRMGANWMKYSGTMNGEAFELFTLSKWADDSNPEPAINIGMWLLQENDYEKAYGYLEDAINLMKAKPDGRVLMAAADCMTALGKRAEARHYIEQAIVALEIEVSNEELPWNLISPVNELCRGFCQLGRFEDAYKAAKILEDKDPFNQMQIEKMIEDIESSN